MKRLKIKTVAPATRAEMESLVGEIAALVINERSLKAEMDAALNTTREGFEEQLADVNEELAGLLPRAMAWAESHTEDFAGKKTLEMLHGLVGWRLSTPTLKPIKGWTWKRVLAKIKSLPAMAKSYIRTKEEVNKQAIIADRDGLSGDALAAIGVKIVALPLQVKSAIQAARFRRLRPQIEMIQRIHRGDPLEAQRQMQRLVGPDSIKYGCALAVVDLVFVVWGLMTLRDYSPQLALDGARFFSVTDVTKPSTVVFWLWIGLSLLQAVVSARAQRMGFGHALVAGLFSGCLFVAIAWYWEWPAYVMIFWGLLTLMALALNLLLLPIAIVRARQDPGYAGTF